MGRAIGVRLSANHVCAGAIADPPGWRKYPTQLNSEVTALLKTMDLQSKDNCSVYFKASR